jgi:O-acetyl-ADP-ribose deacetylase (regulator of RNase III)
MRAELLPLAAYRTAIHLDEPWHSHAAAAPDEIDRNVAVVLSHLHGEGIKLRAPLLPDEALRALLTVRPAGALPEEVQAALDRLLTAEREAKGIVRATDLPRMSERLALWRGDITRLEIDAVTNAANSALRGCFQPFHPCIDNALHWQAGPRMRLDCDTIMNLQGHDEPTGGAKVTRGYNLPARFVLHTVGPRVTGDLSQEHRDLLASCYRSCLDLAQEIGVRALAFCAISTGVFGFPNEPAAEIALETVTSWLERNGGGMDLVVFDVFTGRDELAYRRAFEGAG